MATTRYQRRNEARTKRPLASSVRAKTRPIQSRKLRSPEDAPRNIIPPVSSTIRSRSAKENITPARFAGRHERTKLRRLVKKKFALIDPQNLDKRSSAWQRYRTIIKGISTDLGGADRLTQVEETLIDACASASIRMYDLSARQLLGDEKVEYNELASAISSIVRIAKHLGVERRPREVVPLASYLNGGKSDGDTIDAEVIE